MLKSLPRGIRSFDLSTVYVRARNNLCGSPFRKSVTIEIDELNGTVVGSNYVVHLCKQYHIKIKYKYFERFLFIWERLPKADHLQIKSSKYEFYYPLSFHCKKSDVEHVLCTYFTSSSPAQDVPTHIHLSMNQTSHLDECIRHFTVHLKKTSLYTTLISFSDITPDYTTYCENAEIDREHGFQLQPNFRRTQLFRVHKPFLTTYLKIWTNIRQYSWWHCVVRF